MVIETDARRFIVDAINLEETLTLIEHKEKKKGHIISNTAQNKDFNEARVNFLKKLCEINSVANYLGKGRDDFKLGILLAAEDILRKISYNQSVATRKLADRIRKSFNTFRILFRKYSENIEVVDPQLRNN